MYDVAAADDAAQIEQRSEHSGYEVDDDDGHYLGIVDFPNGPPRRGAPDLSTLWFRSSTGRRICIPSYAIFKFGELVGCLRRPPPCECARGELCPRNWPDVKWTHVTVLTAIDEEGLTVAGWFVRFPATPRSLVRIPPTVVDAISSKAVVGSDAWRMADVSALRPSVDFLALAEARYAHLVLGPLRLWRASKRRRGALATEPPALPVVPSQWADCALRHAPHSLCDGECTVCYKEGPVLVASCCGVAAATCRECNERLRGACIVCQREKLNAKYTCACCGATDVALSDYGNPCDTCAARVLCNGCYSARAACCACDPLRH